MMRAALTGGLAGAISVLPLYHGLWTALAGVGLWFKPYPADGVPLILMLALTGGMLGAGFGLAARHWRRPPWQGGVLLGLLVTLSVWFAIAPLAREPDEPAWQLVPMAHSASVFTTWGALLGLIFPFLSGKPRQRPAPD